MRVPVRELHPWDAVIQQTKLLEQEVPSFFQDEAAMKEVYLPEEEVLQTTTCSTRDLNEDIEGWRKAFTNELGSFDRLNVKTDVWESTLDKSQVEILPGKVVMVKKPIGDGTHLKKGRVVVCGNFQQVQPGEGTCANTPSFPMLRTKGHLWFKFRSLLPSGWVGASMMNTVPEAAVPSPRHLL